MAVERTYRRKTCAMQVGRYIPDLNHNGHVIKHTSVRNACQRFKGAIGPLPQAPMDLAGWKSVAAHPEPLGGFDLLICTLQTGPSHFCGGIIGGAGLHRHDQ
jgi:hypothetical protein